MDTLTEAVDKFYKIQNETLTWPRNYGKTLFFKDYWDKMASKMLNNWSVGTEPMYRIGVDMGCEGTQSNESYYKQQYNELKENHLGAETERFIEMARNEGRNEHLLDKVYELESKLRDSNHALMRATQQVQLAENEMTRKQREISRWQQNAYDATRRYENLKKKHAPKKVAKPAKKIVKKKK